MAEPLRLLIIEDDEHDAELLRLELEGGGFDLEWLRIDTEEALQRALDEREWDLVISDFAMPHFDGLHAFEIFRERGTDLPFIFVSGALGEDRAVEAMRAGAHDYLVKGKLARLNVAVRRELRSARHRSSERAAQHRARSEQRRLTMAVEATGAGVLEYALPLGLDLYFSERCAEILGYTVAEVPGPAALSTWVMERIHPDDRVAHGPSYLAFVAGHSGRFAADLRLRDKSGEWVDVAVSLKAVGLEPGGGVAQVAGSMIDLTERKLLEAQFRQAQKMEAVGRLAGGVAHDFNNLLTAIFAFGKFVRDTLPPDSRAHKDMDELLRVAKRAENLTGQLLAFSRRQTIAPRVLNLNAIVQDIDRMVRRLLGDDIDFSTNLAPDLGNTRVDRGAFEQVMVNLAVNARDAMPDGGKLTIETQNVELQESYAKQHGAEVAPGSYVLMALSDSGIGMDEETQQHIFEPFYTNKEPGKGTGLGLSTCYGIVKQAGGYIWVYSELGEGTTFKVYLPRVLEEEESPWEAPPPESLLGTERILIAEDNEHVRIIASRSLAELGYVVVQTANPDEAIAAAESAAQPFDLLLTDVVMPGMSGKQLAERLQAAQPGLRVIYMTGYTANAIVHRGVLEPGTHLVQKPFTPESLAQKVRQALDTDSIPPPPDGAEGEQE
jgi:hypothetical protein